MIYQWSRAFLVLSVILLAYSLAVVIIITAPASLVFVGLAAVGVAAKKGTTKLWSMGTGEWATEKHLKGMLGATKGLILGRLIGGTTGVDFSAALNGLFNGQVSPEQACRDFLDAKKQKKKGGPLVRLPQAVHTSIYAPTRSGKGVSCIIPFLMTCEDSCTIIDPKGENALLTAKIRERTMGHEVIILDPFKVVTPKLNRKSNTLNIIDFIGQDDPQALEICNAAAKELVIRTGEEKEVHFLDGAESHIAAVMATVVRYGTPGQRSLQEVSGILNHPQKLDMAIKLMCESDAWGGMLARKGGELLHYVDKERSSTLTTASRFLKFLNTPAMAENTRSSDFDLLALPKRKMTIYIVPGLEFMKVNTGWMRLVIGACVRAVLKGGLQERQLTHLILDEAASLGQMDVVEDVLDKGAGFGLRMQLYYQSLGQLKKCWPKDGGTVLLSNTSKVVFAVNDLETAANLVSPMLGKETIIVESGGTGKSGGRNSGWTEGGQGPTRSGGSNSGWSSNENWQQTGRELLKPEEVLQLPQRTAITFTPGVPPIMTNLIRYYEEPELFRGVQGDWLARTLAAWNMLGRSLVLLLFSLLLAGVMTTVVSK